MLTYRVCGILDSQSVAVNISAFSLASVAEILIKSTRYINYQSNTLNGLLKKKNDLSFRYLHMFRGILSIDLLKKVVLFCFSFFNI